MAATLDLENLKDEALLEYRTAGDPLADEVIATIFRTGEVTAVRALLRHLVTYDELPSAESAPPGLSPEVLAEVSRFLELSQATLEPLDAARIVRGEEFFADHGPEILMILAMYSLPASYTAKRGVQVLAQTKRLESHPMRRLIETTQMVVDVMSPGGLALASSPADHGKGVRTAQKVRLMHGAIRHLILAQYGQEWVEKYGVPINQMDLAGTLMTFSSVVLDGLRVLGVENEREGQEAYLYAWRAIGRLMGISDELIPNTVEQASRLTAAIRRLEYGHSAEGVTMTRALVDTLEAQVDPHVFRGIVVSMMHQFLGQYAEAIELPRPNWTRILIRPIITISRWIDAIHRDFGALAWIHRKIALAVIRGFLEVERGPERPDFELPDHLATGWGLAESAS